MVPITSRLSDMLSDVLFTPVQVAEVTYLASCFVKIRITSQAFQRAQWTPGDKMQVRTRRGSLQMRAYTPISWDHHAGSTELIAFLHGSGPAADWFGNITIGAECEAFGPSRSLDLSKTAESTVFVGDETSVALAHALRTVNPSARCIYEATDLASLCALLAMLKLNDNTRVVTKSQDRSALLEQLREAMESASGPQDLIVSGDAATVNAVRRAVRRWPDIAPRIKARAYWAHGRPGLS
ncbi:MULTISPECIES: siderophore-interacting protein [unclassified Mycobacterium]|uniref:siderophore-interacting protein n=1 Tax=unclassified Mycobacterium TaxID=2642494 RepID=UPI000991DCFC|nr:MULTISPECIES: siderophore-interacting protein [unclassified Mycobacterium]